MKKDISSRLFGDFPEITKTTWEEKIRSDLKGADYARKLIWKSDEGVDVKPYYREEDLEGISHAEKISALRRPGSAPNSWTLCQDVYPDAKGIDANAKALAALRGGAQALRFQLGNLSKTDMPFFRSLLKDINLEETELLFQGFLGADALYNHLRELSLEKGIQPAKLKGCLGGDPLGKMAANGIPYVTSNTLVNLVKTVRKESPDLRVLDIDGGMFQEAGATLVEELAFALAMAHEYLNLLTTRGVDAHDVLSVMQFSLSSGNNYFMEIAKIRALRILWPVVCKAYELEAEDCKMIIHSTSSKWNMTRYDAHVNMLRGTTEAMSAILGGADLVSVIPFDHPASSTHFTDRIARNVQIILRDEAYLERVADPAAGSYYIESLTDSMAEKAWELFKEIEQGGGFMKALEKGVIQDKVASSRQKKTDRFDSGRDHLLGTNAFPDFNEFILEQVKDEKTKEIEGAPLKAIRPFRLSSSFETLRLETEKSRIRPRVFLLKYGNPAWVSARATFSGNFFACAGYEIINQSVAADLDEAISSARESQADVIVLCSSDDAYAEMVPAVSRALDKQCQLVVAGYPKDQLEELKAAGAGHFIHMKSNLLQTLQEFNKLLLS